MFDVDLLCCDGSHGVVGHFAFSFIRCLRKLRLAKVGTGSRLAMVLGSERPPVVQRRRHRKGCVARLVGTRLHLLVVGVGNPIAVPSMPWLGARRGESGSYDPHDLRILGSLGTEGF
jgi:hypothetical protein